MNVRIAYYVIALASSLAAFAVAYVVYAAAELPAIGVAKAGVAPDESAAAYTIATAVSLASFAGAFVLGERTRRKSAD
jgi:hypothetical protein